MYFNDKFSRQANNSEKNIFRTNLFLKGYLEVQFGAEVLSVLNLI